MSRILAFIFVILCLGLSVSAQTTPESTKLVPGQPVEREIAGGESHDYRIALQAGQFMRVVLEQKAIDVTLARAALLSELFIDMNCGIIDRGESPPWRATLQPLRGHP